MLRDSHKGNPLATRHFRKCVPTPDEDPWCEASRVTKIMGTELPSSCFCHTKGKDTVGQPPSTEIGVPNMPSLKAKKLRKLPREKVLLERGSWPYRREHAIRRRSLYLLYRQSLTRIGDTSIVSKGHCKNFPLL